MVSPHPHTQSTALCSAPSFWVHNLELIKMDYVLLKNFRSQRCTVRSDVDCTHRAGNVVWSVKIALGSPRKFIESKCNQLDLLRVRQESAAADDDDDYGDDDYDDDDILFSS